MQKINWKNESQERQKVIGEETPVVRELMKDGIGNVLEIGRRMERVYEVAGYDLFRVWLEVELNVSAATASRYRNAARYFGNRPSLIGFQAAALFLLARRKVPEEARREAYVLANRGERITVRAAREIVHRYLAPRPRAKRPVSYKTFCKVVKAAAAKSLTPQQMRALAQQLVDLAQHEELDAWDPDDREDK